MTSRDFCFWMQGFFEIGACVPQPHEPHGGGGLNSEQVDCIRRHLALVFKHEIDPNAGTPAHRGVLDEIHSPPKLSEADVKKIREAVAAHPPSSWGTISATPRDSRNELVRC